MPLYFVLRLCLCHFHKYFFHARLEWQNEFLAAVFLGAANSTREQREKKRETQKAIILCANDSTAAISLNDD